MSPVGLFREILVGNKLIGWMSKIVYYFDGTCLSFEGFLVDQLVKNLPAVQETGVQPLGLEDTLEKEMATHSSILAWKILWIEEPGGLKPMSWQNMDMT